MKKRLCLMCLMMETICYHYRRLLTLKAESGEKLMQTLAILFHPYVLHMD
jgi:hypothetical protein